MVYPWKDGGVVKRCKFSQEKLEFFSKNKDLTKKIYKFCWKVKVLPRDKRLTK
jgi:hypothetical protein